MKKEHIQNLQVCFKDVYEQYRGKYIAINEEGKVISSSVTFLPVADSVKHLPRGSFYIFPVGECSPTG